MIHFMTVLYARWRFENYTQDKIKSRILLARIFFEKNRETLFSLKLHSSELLSF